MASLANFFILIFLSALKTLSFFYEILNFELIFLSKFLEYTEQFLGFASPDNPCSRADRPGPWAGIELLFLTLPDNAWLYDWLSFSVLYPAVFVKVSSAHVPRGNSRETRGSSGLSH